VLALGVAVPSEPRSVAKPNVADLGEEKAFPAPSSRQARLAFPGKLVSQRVFFPARGAEDDGTEFSTVPAVGAEDLFALSNRFGKQVIPT